MPEYLAPGVYVEETSFRGKSIEGVGTSTTGFVGPTRKGPITGTPELLTSFGDFERIYGSLENLPFTGGLNFLAHSVRSYFENGGSRLYVARAFQQGGDNGRAQSALIVDGGAAAEQVRVVARFPGTTGNGRLLVREALAPATARSMATAPQGTIVRIGIGANQTPAGPAIVTGGRSPIAPANNSVLGLTVGGADSQITFGPNVTTIDELNALLIAGAIPARAALSHETGRLILATTATGAASSMTVRDMGATSAHGALSLTPGVAANGTAGDGTATFFMKVGNNWVDSAGGVLNVAGVTAADFVTPTVVSEDLDGGSKSFDDLGFDRTHPRWVGNYLAETPARRADALENMFGLQIGAGVSGLELRNELFAATTDRTITLTGGNDGTEPAVAAYQAALQSLEALEDVSIVAAPGHSAYADFQAIQLSLISHVERRRAYRIAVLDTPANQALSEARTVRSRIDSKYAALYYPWVVIANPLARPGDESVPREITLPPSGFICGIYARNDVERGVAKTPANEVVRSALRFESDINFAQQEVLNPLGINCLRYFPGRGYRVWGGRTVSSDPEWKYVNVRRYFNFLEASIDRGTQWAVFENNGPRLWTNVRDTISDFLYNEWVEGSLLGATPKEAFFVRCDRSTMTQNDLDNGRLICLIGVAVLKPAEFVIFRIGQKTADARS